MPKLLAVLTFLVAAATGIAAPRPNVVLVMTDDQGYGDIAALGNTMIHTPHLDKLHAQSVRLANYHVDPTCAPTRAALLTGRYSSRTGVWHTVMGRSIMRREERTIAEHVRDAGYRTAIFGKWHLGDAYPARPEDQGFDEVLIHGGGGVGQTPDYWANDYFDDTYFHNARPVKFSGYCTDVFFSQATRFIEAAGDRPFFCYIATNAPHSPYNVDPRYARRYLSSGVPQPMANFYAMIENIDENVGRLRQRLRELGLEDNTIFIFTTDNGTAAGVLRSPPRGKGKEAARKAPPTDPAAPAWRGFNAHMRGQKGSEYDGGHRVPLFIRWPAGDIGGGRDVTQLTAHIDVLPTLLELCGVSRPSGGLPIDGVSLVPLLRGQAANWPTRTLTVHNQRLDIPEKGKQSSVMTDRWRFVNGSELYDIHADPGQARNVVADHADVAAELGRAYERWWASISERFDEEVAYVIGSPHEQVARINAMDWHAPMSQIPWNHEMIEQMPEANGYWAIEVAREGRYEFMLRMKPEEAQFPITAATATLQVGSRVQHRQVLPEGTTGVPITLTLKPGRYRMQTSFTDADGKTRGAFYVYVRFAGEAD